MYIVKTQAIQTLWGACAYATTRPATKMNAMSRQIRPVQAMTHVVSTV